MASVLKAPRAARRLAPEICLTAAPQQPIAGSKSMAPRRVAGEVYGWAELKHRFESVRLEGRDDQIMLYRHGATNYNDRNLVSGQHDTALSEEGRRQA